MCIRDRDKEELLALSTQQLDKQQVTLEEQAKLLSLSLSQLDEKEKELLDKQSAFDLQSVELEAVSYTHLRRRICAGRRRRLKI